MIHDYTFTFGQTLSQVHIREQTPSMDAILEETGGTVRGVLLVCDTNTEYLVRSRDYPLCVLESGEAQKGWSSVEQILKAANAAGLGRDGLFIGIGGGVITDMTSFAASIYMRGASLCLISTTLLGMVDASVGGKTGFDLFNRKNLAGTFFPASHIYMPLEVLKTLPPGEWKSGMAELIKTAILDSGETLDKLKAAEPFMRTLLSGVCTDIADFKNSSAILVELIERAVLVKGRIVERDPKETGTERALLNLGHTFGHALESAAGLGKLSHGEAVAWGVVRSCELGLALGITPKERAREIMSIITGFGYETAASHPAIKDTALFMQALGGDKKKRAGKLNFVVPAASGAELISAASIKPGILERIINGEKLR